ncbi:MAG: IS110 family transposase [Candidatus Thermoplasmatota archaeon]|nr:IS110 family transposase [Candidatus Thermoplasmatota archaeon]MDI6856652.1 IS110 family transposase [Candidatus Thermoplasmatota archaeon]
MLYAGLDLHKNFSQVIICREDGCKVKDGRICSTREEISKFFSGFKEPLKIAIEATTACEWVFDLLEEQGYEVVLAHPLKTRWIAESKIKTDKIDAKILAHLLRTDLLPTAYMPAKEIRDLRWLVRRRIFLGRFSGKLKNRIYAELIRRGIKYEVKKIFARKYKSWLQILNIPAINSYLSMLESIEEQIKKLDWEIREAGKKYEEVRIIDSIPGIGPYGALIIFSVIGQIERFRDEEKLFSYGGLVSSVSQSGDSRYYGRITKQGSNELRWMLVEAARAHINWAIANGIETKISRYYWKLRRKKSENKAIMGATRKMLQAIYWMLKNKEEYRS